MNRLIKALAIIVWFSALAAPVSASIERDVQAADLNGYIDVEVRGNTVTLVGFVQDERSRELAERVAKSDGHEVVNHLIVLVEGGVGFF